MSVSLSHIKQLDTRDLQTCKYQRHQGNSIKGNELIMWNPREKSLDKSTSPRIPVIVSHLFIHILF